MSRPETPIGLSPAHRRKARKQQSVNILSNICQYGAVTMEAVDRVWIRATGTNTCLLRPGDRHLWMLLRVHRMMLGGGALLAASECSEHDLMAAVEAAEYFDLPELAKAIHGVSVLTIATADEVEILAASLTEEYRQAAPSGSVIVTAFHKRYRATPGDFAPT